MSIGIKTLEAADNGITADHEHDRVDAVDAAPGAAGQVVPDQVLYDRRDRDPAPLPVKNLSFSGGAVGSTRCQRRR